MARLVTRVSLGEPGVQLGLYTLQSQAIVRRRWLCFLDHVITGCPIRVEFDLPNVTVSASCQFGRRWGIWIGTSHGTSFSAWHAASYRASFVSPN